MKHPKSRANGRTFRGVIRIRIKVIIIILLLVVVSACYAAYNFHLRTIDTVYATRYYHTIGSYDIAKVDEYLEADTLLIYKSHKTTYRQARINVINAFNEKIFVMHNGSSYGYGDNKFSHGVQTVYIQSYVEYNNASVEVPVEMQLKRIGVNEFVVQSLRSDEDFFGYLFFAEEK